MSPFAMALCTQICLTGPGQPHVGPPPTSAPLPMCPVPLFSSAQGRAVSGPASSVDLSPTWVLVSRMFLSEIRGSLVSSPVLGPISFCSWLGSLDVPGTWSTTCHIGVWVNLSSQLTFLREQPALTTPWRCQKTVKELECLCCQNTFSRCTPQVWKQELTQSKKYVYLCFQFCSSSAWIF